MVFLKQKLDKKTIGFILSFLFIFTSGKTLDNLGDSPGLSNRWLLSCNQAASASTDVKDRAMITSIQEDPSNRVSNFPENK